MSFNVPHDERLGGDCGHGVRRTQHTSPHLTRRSAKTNKIEVMLLHIKLVEKNRAIAWMTPKRYRVRTSLCRRISKTTFIVWPLKKKKKRNQITRTALHRTARRARQTWSGAHSANNWCPAMINIWLKVFCFVVFLFAASCINPWSCRPLVAKIAILPAFLSRNRNAYSLPLPQHSLPTPMTSMNTQHARVLCPLCVFLCQWKHLATALQFGPDIKKSVHDPGVQGTRRCGATRGG